MIKFILGSILAFASAAASAQSSLSVAYGQQTDNTGAQSHIELFIFKTRLYNNLDGDILIINKTADVSNSVTDRVEAGLTYFKNINNTPITPTLRVSLGQKQKSGETGYTYYTVEPGVAIRLPNNFSAKASYYYRDTVNDFYRDNSNEMRYSVSYEITKVDKITLGAFRVISAAVPTNTNYIMYTRGF
jgi:hypothetical protein